MVKIIYGKILNYLRKFRFFLVNLGFQRQLVKWLDPDPLFEAGSTGKFNADLKHRCPAPGTRLKSSMLPLLLSWDSSTGNLQIMVSGGTHII